MRNIAEFLRDAWHLSRPYFTRSEERRSAWLLLAAVIAMRLFLVGMEVVLSFWNNAFFTSLQEKDWDSFIGLLLTWKVTDGGLASCPVSAGSPPSTSSSRSIAST